MAERRLAAIMFTDLVGSTALMAQSEEAGLRAKRRHRELVKEQVARYGGEFIESKADETLSIFASALEAANCALAVQHAPRDDDFRLHVGLHSGDVILGQGEIHGDAVNIAARLASLSEGGGIRASAEVVHAIRNRPEIPNTYLGEQHLKNVNRPIAVYALGDFAVDSDAPQFTVPGFGQRPAIAVLPFHNLSPDPNQEYFADAITEDLIRRLSSQRWFPVISRNSTSVYKRDSVEIRQVARDLGVLYVVEGSVRKEDDRLRISAQLIEAPTGHNVWAESYDRECRDVFSLQDEVTAAICGAIEPELREFEPQRSMRQTEREFDAWESVQRGIWFFDHYTKEDNDRALSLFRRAVELDPSFASGCEEGCLIGRSRSESLGHSRVCPSSCWRAREGDRRAPPRDRTRS
jgi:adenylate cyclase